MRGRFDGLERDLPPIDEGDLPCTSIRSLARGRDGLRFHHRHQVLRLCERDPRGVGVDDRLLWWVVGSL